MFEFIPGFHDKITGMLDPILDFLHLRLKLSPHALSLIGAVFGFGSVVLVISGKWQTAIIAILIYYVFDLLDGNTARKFGLVTKRGKILDLIIDRGIVLAMLLAVAHRGEISLKMAFLAALAIILMTIMKERAKIDIGLKNIIIGYLIGLDLAITLIFFVNLLTFMSGLVILDYKKVRSLYKTLELRNTIISRKSAL